MVNFHRCSIPHATEKQALLNCLLSDSRKNDKRLIPWTVEAENVFEQVKQDLANTTLLAHPSHSSKTRLVTDASDFGMGASLKQRFNGVWKPLAFFLGKSSPAQTNYSAWDRQLMVIFEAIRHFRYFLEGQIFTVVTDHKPLIFAFSQKYEKPSQRQQRQLSFIPQFTTHFEHLSRVDNVIANSQYPNTKYQFPNTDFSITELHC